jgi:hypothetical protein
MTNLDIVYAVIKYEILSSFYVVKALYQSKDLAEEHLEYERSKLNNEGSNQYNIDLWALREFVVLKHIV